jgi:hypothetical protein
MTERRLKGFVLGAKGERGIQFGERKKERKRVTYLFFTTQKTHLIPMPRRLSPRDVAKTAGRFLHEDRLFLS